MHSKFLVFLLIVFFFFSFFSSACEFRFIERIGAHGKQNPDFIIILYDRDKLKTALDYLLFNSFVRFGPHVFKQIKRYPNGW